MCMIADKIEALLAGKGNDPEGIAGSVDAIRQGLALTDLSP